MYWDFSCHIHAINVAYSHMCERLLKQIFGWLPSDATKVAYDEKWAVHTHTYCNIIIIIIIIMAHMSSLYICHFQSCLHCAAFRLMQTCRELCPLQPCAPRMRGFIRCIKLTNLCLCGPLFIWQKGGGGVRERPTAAKAGSPDIIEDDISDYPKDRNLSLSVVYFQLFYHPCILRARGF